jgi:PAP2 superfamily
MRARALTPMLGLLAVLAAPVAVASAASDAGGIPIAPVGSAPDCRTPTETVAPQTIVGVWNCAALEEIRASTALRNGPPIVARALAIVHTCMYDAWAAYDRDAVGTTDRAGTRRRPRSEHTEANKAQAISFAAHRCLRNLYPGPAPTARLDAVLAGQGYDVSATSSTDPTTPAGIGHLAAQAVIDARANDGSNQYGTVFAEDPPCAPDAVCPSVPINVLGRVTCELETYPWTPTPLVQLLDAPIALQPLPGTGPGGKESGPYADYVDAARGYQPYIPSNPLMGYCTPLLASCPGWPDVFDPYIDPALPWPNVADPNRWQPLIFSSHARQTFVGAHFERVTPFALTSASQFDDLIPPPDYLKNSGHYQKNVNDMIKFSASLDESRKLIVEYWADGPDSEFPPGHWALFAQFVSRRDAHTIDQDAKMFFAMHNASFDAGIVAWHTKRKYNGVRPITAVRYTKRGQTIRAWGGPGRPIEIIRGEQWTPYNPGTNLTPPFPGYFSGHSVFSRSSATVLGLFTGSDQFGFSTLIKAGFGRVEPHVPPVDTVVSFATFSDAAAQAGLSRLYGGIHFADDNTVAQAVGRLIGEQAWAKAQRYFSGAAALD